MHAPAPSLLALFGVPVPHHLLGKKPCFRCSSSLMLSSGHFLHSLRPPTWLWPSLFGSLSVCLIVFPRRSAVTATSAKRREDTTRADCRGLCDLIVFFLVSCASVSSVKTMSMKARKLQRARLYRAEFINSFPAPRLVCIETNPGESACTAKQLCLSCPSLCLFFCLCSSFSVRSLVLSRRR